jgi:hypothetical protein
MTRLRLACLALVVATAVGCGGSGRRTVEVKVNEGVGALTLGMTRSEVDAATGRATSGPVVTTSQKIVVEFDASNHVASLHIRGGDACLVRPHVCIGERGGARKAAEAYGRAARAESDDFQTMVVIRGTYRGRKTTTMLWYSAPGSASSSDEGPGEPANKVPASAPIRAIDLYLSD